MAGFINMQHNWSKVLYAHNARVRTVYVSGKMRSFHVLFTAEYEMKQSKLLVS